MDSPRRREAEPALPCSPGLPDGDTYGRSRGALSSSFSIFASRTLWGEGDKASVVRPRAAAGEACTSGTEQSPQVASDAPTVQTEDGMRHRQGQEGDRDSKEILTTGPGGPGTPRSPAFPGSPCGEREARLRVTGRDSWQSKTPRYSECS